MVKISALPPMTAPDGDDEAPIVDDSVGTTKKFTLTQLKEWLQSLSGWISEGMIATAAIANSKLKTGTNEPGGSWDSWSPTLTNLSGGTLNYAKYKVVGNTVHVRFKYTLAGAGVGGEIDVTYPVTANADLVDVSIGVHNGFGTLRSATAGFPLVAMHNNIDKFRLRHINNTPNLAGINSTTPFTFTNGSIVMIAFNYEKA